MAADYQRNLFTGREGVCRRQNRFLGWAITPTNYGCLQGDGMSRDPVGYKAGTNLFSYAGNNPINKVDSKGLYTLVELLVVISIIEILAGMLLPGLRRVKGPGSNPGGGTDEGTDNGEGSGNDGEDSDTNSSLSDLDLVSPGTTGNLITLPTGSDDLLTLPTGDSTVDDWDMPVTNAVDQTPIIQIPRNNSIRDYDGEIRLFFELSGSAGLGLPFGVGAHGEANIGLAIPFNDFSFISVPDFGGARFFFHNQAGPMAVAGAAAVIGPQIGGTYSRELLPTGGYSDRSMHFEFGQDLAPAFSGGSLGGGRTDTGKFNFFGAKGRPGGFGGGLYFGIGEEVNQYNTSRSIREIFDDGS